MDADGPFSFKVASNGAYAVTIAQQPWQSNCSIANGTGTMSGEAARTNIAVSCVPNVPVSGVINGLKDSTSITLRTNIDDSTGFVRLQPVATTPPDPSVNNFVLTQYAVRNTDYDVYVYSQPAAQYCSVVNGKGRVTTQTSITGVQVNCVPAVPVTMTITGLTPNYNYVLGITNTITQQGQTLKDAGLYQQVGTYTFNMSLLDGAAYNVAVTTQPPGQTCTVTNGVGVVSMANPANSTNIVVDCK